MQRLAEETVRAWKIEFCVRDRHNTPQRSMKNLTAEIWDMMLSVNLNGAYYITRAVLPAMREAGAGH